MCITSFYDVLKVDTYFLLPTSYFLLPISYFLLPTSYFLLPTSSYNAFTTSFTQRPDLTRHRLMTNLATSSVITINTTQ